MDTSVLIGRCGHVRDHMTFRTFVTCVPPLSEAMSLDCGVVRTRVAMNCLCLIFMASGDDRSKLNNNVDRQCIEPQDLAKLARATIVRHLARVPHPPQAAALPTVLLPAILPPRPPARRPPAISVA